jgi:hypothetical protein
VSERSFPFDGGQGAILNETDWSAMASTWQDDGVADVPNGDALRVVSEEVAGKLVVRSGRASFKGFHYYLDTDTELSYMPNTDATLARPDLVVLRLDWGTNRVYVAIKEGVPGGQTPTPDTAGQTPEMPLASYAAPANSGPVLASQIIDLRPYAGGRIRVARDTDVDFPDGTIFYSTATGTFYGKTRPAGSSSSVVSPLAPFNEIRRRSNNLALTASVASDSELTIPVDRGAFQYEAQIFYQATVSSGSMTIDLLLPALGASGKNLAQYEFINSVNANLQVGWSSSSTGVSVNAGANAVNFPRGVHIRGSFVNTAGSAGNVTFGYSGNASNPFTILAGSYLTVRRI